MKELTSSFDDMEKRMAIFIGLGAFLLNSLYCFVKQADVATFLIQGTLVAVVFMLLGWGYGNFVKHLVEEHAPSEGTDSENVEFRNVDAEHVEGSLVSELPDTVVEETGEVLEDEQAQTKVQGFEMPELGEPDLPPPPPAAPTPLPFAAPEPPAPVNMSEPEVVDKGDLPPPPVPTGL